MNHTIVLIGFKACGKSTIGKALARHLDYQWIDTDRNIEVHYFNQHQQQLSCQEIVHRHNIDYFKAIESIIFKQLNPARKSIISTGGSSFHHTNNHTHLPENCQVIYLKSDIHTLTQRWRHHPPPWLIEDINHPLSQKALHDRDQCFRQLAGHTIDVSLKTIDEICQTVCTILLKNST